MMQTIKLAVIPGDGIGKEVVPEGLKVLDRILEGTGIEIQSTAFDLGAERWHRTGQALTDDDLEAIKEHDAILLGAVGDPSVPSGVLERGLLLRLRFALDHYVNLRPSVYYPGVPTPLADPGNIDFVVVREGTEGLYCGNGGVVRQGTAHEIATEISINTAYGVERLVRYAFAKAQARTAKHLTLVHKSILLRLNSSSSLPSSKRFSSCSLDMSLIEMKFLPTWSTASMRPFMERMYLDMGDS